MKHLQHTPIQHEFNREPSKQRRKENDKIAVKGSSTIQDDALAEVLLGEVNMSELIVVSLIA